MDIFNRKKVKKLEDKIYDLNFDIRIKDARIAELKRDLAPYVSSRPYEKGRSIFYKQYTLHDAEIELCQIKLYVSVLEGELGPEKTNSAKNKYKALKEIVKNNTLQKLTIGDTK